MQTHVVRFDRPLTNVALVPVKGQVRPAAHTVPATLSPSPEVGQTEFPPPAKSLDSHFDLPALLAKINQNIEVLSRNQNESLQQLHELSIRLANRIARAVVLYEVSHHDSRIRALLDTFLKRSDPQHPVVVHVNKKDMDRLLISLPDSPSLDSAIRLQQDDSVMPGDCRVESAHQCVVASYDRQLDEIQEQLMEALEHARTERTYSDTTDFED